MKKIIKIDDETDKLRWLYSQDVEYYNYGNCKRHLQIIFPYKDGMKKEEKYPLILFIPGSAWHKQEMYNDILNYAKLAKRGYVVAAMEYRESDIAQFPAQVDDVCNALKFIPSVAEVFHIDMGRIFLMGNSSGGHIAMMSVLFSEHGLCEKLPKISGVILESASTDIPTCAKEPLPSWMDVRPSAVLLGVDKIEENEEIARKASCGMYVTKDIKLPAVLLIHSEFDPVVSVENSRILYEKLIETGHGAHYYELEGSYAHGGVTYYNDTILNIIDEFCVENLE
ncbi:alpha/beta hydrolase [Eubacterium sp. MSJ-13]|uniref:alpha/beta hydrolase n=1 Tax=Eubacterium sp. MSJ-13 TaxID=2841513 RepID=UPI001C105C5D|nr:alpha/beta hydrolase [Eubacterium sp. MSJ-13]MBU5479546.1 alpha/beta hydrolase [Eubacterium sp. MSJ-13]